MKSSFNAFGSGAAEYGQLHTPVWLGVVSPVPVGGTLVEAFRKKGILIPAGAGVNLNNKVITPLLTYVVKAVDTGVITIDPKEYGYEPKVGDYLFKVSTSDFANNGTPVAITAVAANADDPKLLDVTVAVNAAANDVVGLAFSNSAIVPNGYLYNDIFTGDLEENVNATGAVVMFHHEGILIDLTPCAGIADAMKKAVPGVYQHKA